MRSISTLLNFLWVARHAAQQPPYCIGAYKRHLFRGERYCQRGCRAENPDYREPAEATA